MIALKALGERDATVKQVASKLGFSSVAAFSYAFRQVMKVQPSEIVRSLKAR